MFQNIRCLTKHWVFLIVVCFSALCHNWRLFFSSCDLFLCASRLFAQCCVLLCTMLWLSTNQVCQPRPDGFPANWSLPRERHSTNYHTSQYHRTPQCMTASSTTLVTPRTSQPSALSPLRRVLHFTMRKVHKFFHSALLLLICPSK